MLPKGYKHSKETREKIRISQKKLSNTPEERKRRSERAKNKGYGLWMKGRKPSEKIKRKISEALKGRGHPHTEDTKKRLSEIKKGKPRNGNPENWKHSKGARMRMSLAHIGKNKGENNNFWQGGKSFEEYGINWTDDLKESIRKRDNHICQMCGLHQDELEGWNKKLDVHHIDYNKYNLNPENLITLCRNCHCKTNDNREYWTNYFKIIYEI